MPWLAWMSVRMLPIVLVACVLLFLGHWLIGQEIKKKKAQMASIGAELSPLRGVDPRRSGLAGKIRAYEHPS